MYEFAFKPRVELVLRSDSVFNTRFNAPLQGLDQMQEVEDEEAANMKAFLKQLNLEPKHQSNMGLDSVADADLGRGSVGTNEPQVHGAMDDNQQHMGIDEDG